MTDTPRTGLEFVDAGTTDIDQPVNNNALALDAVVGMSVVSATTTAQPALTSPADDGKVYILPAGRTGTNWGAQAVGTIAQWYSGTWYFYTPWAGLRARAADSGIIYQFTTAWAVWASVFGQSLINDADAAAARVTLGAVPGNILVRAYRSATQTIAPGAFSTVVFDTENYDVGGNYNTATGEFTAPLAGIYAISAFIHARNVADAAQLATSVFINGAEAARLGEESVSNPAADANLAVMNGSATYYRLAASDAVTIRWFCSASVLGDCVVTPFGGGSVLTYFIATLLFAE